MYQYEEQSMTFEEMKHSLLLVSRMYQVNFNRVDEFVCFNEHQTLDYFKKHIYDALLYRVSPKVDTLLNEILTYLSEGDNNV
jgi:hypothetical protein